MCKVGDDFVAGESAAMLTGFKLPTANASGTVDTLDTALNSFNIKYSGGNATDNYKFDLSNTVASITINTVSVTSADYSLSADGTIWQNSDLTLAPANDYTWISTDGVSWQSALTLSNEGEQSVTFFLKKDDGTVTESEIITYKLDKTAPSDIKIQYNQSDWKSFLNTITFGLFFKEPVDVKATATDLGSGIKSIEYYASDTELTDFTAVPWQNSLSLAQNSKKIVYIRATDNAGNETITNNEGIVVYSDSAVTPATADFDKKADLQQDINFTMALNGNTLKSIKNGDAELVSGTDYTVSESTVTIAKEYLAAQANGTITLTFSFYPMGVVNDSTLSTASAIITVGDTTHYPTWETEFTVDKEPTCTEKGEKSKHCIDFNICGERTEITEIASLGHDFGSWTSLDGTNHQRVCQNDATHIETEAHSGGTATCHTKAVCSVCGAEYGEFDPDNHDGKTEIRNAVAATHTTEGYTGDTYCLGCGEKIAAGNIIPKIAHDWDSKWTFDENNHWHICNGCDEIGEKSGHSGGTATCHTKAVCSVCGAEYGEFDPDNHDGKTEIRNAVAATHTTEGYTGDTYCLGCGEKIAAGNVIPKIAHDWDSKWTFDENSHWHICSGCDEIGEKSGHIRDDGKITSEPSAAATGQKTFTCTVCGETKTDKIAKLNPSVIEGANGAYQQGSKTGLSFKSDAALSDFEEVLVDGAKLNNKSFEVVEGSTIVTLKPEYLDTLSVGEHTLEMNFSTGTASANFTIEAKSAEISSREETTFPKTGDANNMALWVAILLFSGGAVSVLRVTKKRRKAK